MQLLRKKWFLMGVTTGVILSLFVMPFIEDCHHLREEAIGGHHYRNWYSLITNDDFNPVVHLRPNQSHLQSKHINEKVFRHKYFSTELDVKENLLICVHLSANTDNAFNSYLLNQTIEEFSDKVMLFYDQSVTTSRTKDMMSRMKSIDSVHPLSTESTEVPIIKPQPKYLNVLNYLFNRQIVQNFNFVFIISDKTFINQNNLYQFLSNFSVSQRIFARPIISHDLQDQQLDSHLNHDLDSGVIFSTSLLLWCHLDNNCLNDYRNKYPNPTQSTFISYKLNTNSHVIDENILNFKTFYSSVTIFPVNSFNTYLKMNLILCQNSIHQTIHKLDLIEEQIITSNDNQSALELSSIWPIGVVKSLKPNNRFDVNRWLYFNESHSLMPNDFDVSLPLTAIETNELLAIKSVAIEWLQNKYHIFITEQNYQLINIYKKFDAIRGLEYLLDFRLTAFEDIKRLQVIKPFNRIELIPDVPYVTESVRIVLILVIKSREEIESTSSFLTQYTNVCLKKLNHRTVLIMVLMYRKDSQNDEYIDIKEEATQLQTKYKSSGAKIAWIPINSAKDNRVPTELAYFDIIVKKLSQSFTDALLLHCRPNMILSLDFLNRVRLNTIQSNQVFFPIPFVEYRLRSQVKPSKHFDVRKDNGFFETTNYNHFSFYLSDYIKTRQESQELLPIAKNVQFLQRSIYYGSDIDIFHLFTNYNKQIKSKPNGLNKSLFIMRAIEPDLRLKHESFNYDCLSYESNRYSIENCEKRTVYGLGSRPQLAALVIDDNKKDGQEVSDDESANVF